ncbi:MAG: diguanylate cyclase [Magnetovibrio sp.]|nr:diguanylate cyclase [Magnetovibrio sp.]
MRSFVSILVLGVLVAGSARAQTIVLSETERNHLRDKGRITMCVGPHWMPYESIDERGRHIGMAADFMDLFSLMLGVSIDLVPTKAWIESLDNVRGKTCDIMSLLNKTADRSAYLNFTDTYLNAVVVLVSRDDVVFLDGFKDLKGRTLGVIKGYVYESHIRDNYPDVRLVYVDNLQDALKRVSRGEIFAAVDSLFILTYQMQQLGLSNLIIAGQTDFSHALRVGVRKDDPVLLSAMQKAVRAIDPVQRNEILQRWFTVRFAHGTDYSILWKVLGSVALLLAFLGYRFVVQKRFNTQLQAKNTQLVHLSQTDPLTGIYNRLKVDAMLEREFERARRYERSLSVVMFDLDFFKQVNDTHGHQAGDRVLIDAAALVRDNIRTHDIFGRWGGEEFLILCPETDEQGAQQLAEHLRAKLESMGLGEIGSITASFGATQLGKTEDAKRLIGNADTALYQAKQDGRNCVRVYKPTF